MKFCLKKFATHVTQKALSTVAVAAAIIHVGTPDSLNAQTLLRTIPNPVPAIADNFGRNTMITDGGFILTGAQANVGNVVNAGAAYLINPANGALVFTLPNPEPESDVGYSPFAWAGDTRVVVSAFFKNDGGATHSGRAYIFNLANGQFLRTILNPTPQTEAQFGYGLGMLGDTAIISSRGDNTAGPGTGTVHLFNSLTGQLIRTIVNPDPTTLDNFGYSVAGIGDNKILVGATGNDTGAPDAGVAFLMDANTGQVIHKIANPDPVNGAFFGFQVRAHGEDLLVGAPGNNKAYLFSGETGALIHRFENPSFKPGASFGSTLASAGRFILVGNPLESFSEEWVGRAYVFNAASGDLVRTIENPTPAGQDRFGVSVAAANGNFIISADQDAVGDLPLVGSVHVFQEPPNAVSGDWNLYQ